jgi:hypothetical protein
MIDTPLHRDHTPYRQIGFEAVDHLPPVPAVSHPLNNAVLPLFQIRWPPWQIAVMEGADKLVHSCRCPPSVLCASHHHGHLARSSCVHRVALSEDAIACGSLTAPATQP